MLSNIKNNNFIKNKIKMIEIKDIKSKINYKHIKSSYIIKKVLSFLNEKQILNIILYNNELQKICLFDIQDYKKISGKYKIGEKYGKGREFIKDTNRLIFEGEYINGKKIEKEKNIILMVSKPCIKKIFKKILVKY